MDCIFCKIASRSIPSKVAYEDDKVLAFEDLNPQAPTHTLIIPKRHISTLNELTDQDRELVGHMVKAAAKVASDKGLSSPGYRVIMNCNADGGQTVFHIHLHLLGGRQMHWPPG